MKTLLISTALLLPLHAAEFVPARVPASAAWVFHADFDAMRASGVGRHIFDRIEAGHGDKLQALKRLSSVHLLTDVRDVTFFGDGKKDHAVVLFHSAFDTDHMVDIVKAAENYRASDHAGTTIHSWKDKDGVQNAAFAEGGLLVMSRQMDALERELDLLKSGGPGLAEPIHAGDAGPPMLALAAKLTEIDLPADASHVLRMVGSLRLSASESADRFAVRLTAGTSKAPLLRRILDGILALAEASNPKLQQADFRAEASTAGDGSAVDVRLSLPVATALEVMREEEARKQAEGKH